MTAPTTPLLRRISRRISLPGIALPSLLSLNNLLQVVGASCGLYGNSLITAGDASGFVVWIVSNAALIWLQCRTRLWTLVGLHICYLSLCFQGIGRWSTRSPQSLPAWLPDMALDFFRLFA